MTKHTDPITRILDAYPPGPGALLALETYCKTVEENALNRGRVEAQATTADTVCWRIHEGPASGLICQACYEAERLTPYVLQVQADMDMDKEK